MASKWIVAAMGIATVQATTCPDLDYMWFTQMPFAYTTTQKQQMAATPAFTTFSGATGEKVTSRTGGYTTLIKTGDTVGNVTFGTIFDQEYAEAVYQLYYDTSSTTGYATNFSLSEISDQPDFVSYVYKNGKVLSYVHIESPTPSAMYQLLSDQSSDCSLTVSKVMPVDWSAYGGLWYPCAGSVTPWDTHLGSEEYEPDAKQLNYSTIAEMIAYDAYGFEDIINMARYFGVYPENITTAADLTSVFYPYRYGFVTEISTDDSFNPTPVKHFSMGRHSVELGKVMPDERTVYMSDDGTNTFWSMYYADTAGDLTSGTLYAAQLTQLSADNGGNFTIEWVDLGHATDDEIAPHIMNTSFYDLFDEVDPVGADCPSGYTSINVGENFPKFECLKVKDGMATLASRLETRRYAGMMGATTEFTKMEGCTYDSTRNTVYLSMTIIKDGMENFTSEGVYSNASDIGGRNDLQLPYNPCGCVYQAPLTAGGDGPMKAYQFSALICGSPDFGTDPLNSCNVNSISSPDNIAYVPEYDYLLIGEDTSYHQNDVAWALHLESGALTRIVETPFGAEVTGVYWYPDVNGCRYISTQGQHPYGESDEDMVDACGSNGPEGYVGFISMGKVDSTYAPTSAPTAAPVFGSSSG